VVGDGGVGKTSLLMSYSSKTFPTDYIPTIFDNYHAVVVIDKKAYNLGLWDTAGQEHYDKLRTASYPHTHVFVLCFSLVQPSSFSNIKFRWYPELKEYQPKTPILLVGTKSDLMNNDAIIKSLAKQNTGPVSYKQALELVDELKLDGYLECSALTQSGVNEVFMDAANLAVGKPAVCKLNLSPSKKLKSSSVAHHHHYRTKKDKDKCVIS